MPEAVLTPAETPTTAAVEWQPSDRLRARLYWGIVAVLVSATLGTLAAVLQLTRDAQPGFSFITVIDVAGLLSLVWVLFAYRALGHETDSRGLIRSSLCAIGSMSLFQLLLLALGRQFGLEGSVVVGMIAGAGFFGLMLYAVPFRRKPRQSGGTFGGGALLLFILFRIVSRALGGKFDINWGLVLGAGVLLCIIGFSLWFAIVKIRLRHKLGTAASGLGWTEILFLVTMIGSAFFYLIKLAEFANQPGVNEHQVRQYFEECLRSLSVMSVGVTLGWSMLTAWLFYTVRRIGLAETTRFEDADEA